MEEQGVTAPLIAMLVGPTTPEFIAGTGKLAENVVTSSWWDVAAKFKGEDVFGSAENFEQLFRKTYNNTLSRTIRSPPPRPAARAAIAITKAGTVDKAKVRDQLAAMDAPTPSTAASSSDRPARSIR